ncbi:MAG: DUF1326 domain-containing protein [Kiloniellaceae bacterium]
MGYNLKGDLLEVCNCNVLCPCWIGEDPDEGYCQSTLAYRFSSGEIDGIDVSGLVAAGQVHIPGNVLAGNWKRQLFISDSASEQQMDAIVSVLTGKKGGPLADLAQLIGEELEPQQAEITFELNEGKGRLKVGDSLEAVMEPYKGPTGKVTTLNESIFTTIPGAPAYVSKAEVFRMRNDAIGADVNLKDHNAIQGSFQFQN